MDKKYEWNMPYLPEEDKKILNNIKNKIEDSVHNIFHDWQEKLNITCGDVDPLYAEELYDLIQSLAVQIKAILNEQEFSEEAETESAD